MSDHFQFALIHGPNIPGSYAILLFTTLDLASITSHVHNAEYIMKNAGLEEAQAGIKIAWRNINNLRYADDTTLMAESEEELKSLLMKLEE